MRDRPAGQHEIDATKHGERAAAFFNLAERAAHFFEVEPVADPDPGAPGRGQGIFGEWPVGVEDQSVIVGEKAERAERLGDPQKIGDDHQEAPESEDDQEKPARGHWGMHLEAPDRCG